MHFTCDGLMIPQILYVGFNLTYCCRSSLAPNTRSIYANLVGRAEIIGPSGTPLTNTDGRVRVSETVQNEHNFGQMFFFSPLSAQDMGQYTCIGTLQPEIPNGLVTNGMGSVTQEVKFPSKYDYLMVNYYGHQLILLSNNVIVASLLASYNNIISQGCIFK